MTERPPAQHSPQALLPVVMVFLVLIGAMWWGFDKALYSPPNRGLAATTGVSGPVVLEVGWDGHFRAPGTINGNRVLFLVDTGASTVAIPGEIARSMGMKRGPRIRVQTASGSATAYVVRLDTVILGNIVQHNVRAAIIPSMKQDSVLLGMSFLNNVSMLKRNSKLVLQQQH